MIKNQIKSSIQRARAGIAFIIVAAVLSQLVNMAQYIYTRKSIQKQSVEKTYNNMLKLQRTAKLQTSVESAVQATMGDVRVNLNNPEMFYGITSRLVANNEYIVGSAIAMRPGYYPDKDKLFAPFAYPENKVQKDSAMWTEPYFDKGGSEMLIRSYSLPIHDHENRVVGILTADVPYKDLASEDDFTYDEIDKINIVGFIFQVLGLLLVFYIVWRYASKFKQFNRLVMEQELLTKELQIASDIQTAMLPNISDIENARHHLDVQKTLLSAPDVSADFYDYFYIGSKVVFCIGDVPGSNVKAALMMSIIRSIFRTSANANSINGEAPSPAAVIRSMNNSLCSVNHSEMFATLFVGVLDLNSAVLTYHPCGHHGELRIHRTAYHADRRLYPLPL